MKTTISSHRRSTIVIVALVGSMLVLATGSTQHDALAGSELSLQERVSPSVLSPQSELGAAQEPVLNPQAPVGSGFNYQGQLKDGGVPANGQYDFTFKLYDTSSGGVQVGGTVSMLNQTVSGGLFAVTLDFGASAYQGQGRWLEIAVRVAGGPSYTTLTPRQALTATPYASGLMPGAVITATNNSSALSGINSSNGTGLTGTSNNGPGIYGTSNSTDGGFFVTSGAHMAGVHGVGSALHAKGVYGESYVGENSAGVYGVTTDGIGVFGRSSYGRGVYAEANVGSNAVGVYATSTDGTGVYSRSTNGIALSAITNGDDAGYFFTSASYANGVNATATGNNGTGVYGEASTGAFATGVWGLSAAAFGVYGTTGGGPTVAGVAGQSTGANGVGVTGLANNGSVALGVWGSSSAGRGVYGSTNTGVGVYGAANGSYGMYGTTTGGATVAGVSGNSTGPNGVGVIGAASNGTVALGVWGSSSAGRGVYGSTNTGVGVYGAANSGWAGYFLGDVLVTGVCCASGAGTFKIDHPLNPENKYLQQAMVQSADMKSIYDGVVTLDSQGEATVTMPTYVASLNTDFRYQLTCIGGYAPVYIAQEITGTGSSFRIAGGKEGMKVSWQVTGIRKDPYALAHPIRVEVEKSAGEKGKYLYPTEYGLPKSKGINNPMLQPTEQQSPNTSRPSPQEPPKK